MKNKEFEANVIEFSENAVKLDEKIADTIDTMFKLLLSHEKILRILLLVSFLALFLAIIK